MLYDLYHNALSTTNQDVAEEINHFIKRLLEIGKGIEAILAAAEKYPEEFLIQVYAGLLHVYGQTEDNQKLAHNYLNKARELLKQANEREKSFFYAVCEWAKIHNLKTLEHLEKHCYQWPTDLAALKVTEYLFYFTGQKYHSKEFLELTTFCQKHLKDDPFFLSIHSFALELNDKFSEAKKEAEKAISINSMNPWAHHTLTHVYIKLPEISQGIDVITDLSKVWPQFQDGISSHNFWHLGLLYMEQLDFKTAADIYIKQGWKPDTKILNVDIDASAIFWRLDMENVDLSDSWQTLAKTINGYAEFTTTAFASTQLIYALRKGGMEDEVSKSLNAIEQFVKNLDDAQDKKMWISTGLPLVHGSLAFAEGNYSKALQFLDPMIKEVGAVGGSDAQIDLFYQTYLKALTKAKRYQDAKIFLNWMTEGRPLTNLQKKWLADCSL